MTCRLSATCLLLPSIVWCLFRYWVPAVAPTLTDACCQGMQVMQVRKALACHSLGCILMQTYPLWGTNWKASDVLCACLKSAPHTWIEYQLDLAASPARLHAKQED